MTVESGFHDINFGEKPSFRPDHINEIVESVSRYNAENVVYFEEYLDSQLKDGKYDLAANLALLKLYQLNSQAIEQSSPDYEKFIGKALVMALLAAPEPDFDLCLSLLLPSTMSSPLVQSLIILQQALESANFTRFWATLAASAPKVVKNSPNYSKTQSRIVPLDPTAVAVLESCTDFVKSVRKYIALAVAISYSSIESSRLSAYINASEDEMRAFVKEYGWTFDAASKSVKLPPWTESHPQGSAQTNQSNFSVTKQATMTSIREDLKFEQLTKIIGYSQGV